MLGPEVLSDAHTGDGRVDGRVSGVGAVSVGDQVAGSADRKVEPASPTVADLGVG